MSAMQRTTRLLLEAQAGDHDALARFIAATQVEVWNLCRYLGDARDADDLAQETYERAISSIHRFRADGSARSWILSIARHVCADHVRRAQRRRARDGRYTATATAGGGVGSVVDADDTARVDLDLLLDGLSSDRREAFVLTQVLGMSYEDAAESLGCPIGTIRSRVARARLDLIDMTAPHPEHDEHDVRDGPNSSGSTGTDSAREAT
ncbi:sigma-70 family RNA polymerase sigma factor [Ilumatobacter coccineus]|uniref:RNA polymerase ECF subfamily sigma factor SigC n=1 Tax=Ilumatobacter coccineus (strain NBRC 103263 / KCTC 29153 / YM16-304) TaxID=1313172 RepID=A0A6C7EDE4_ILUCY|nr:sigma-70 family RNA polymerase sigma factor [Ilumatobacter coccineus]BAN04012.1 RNA polymerase ECF subfamily sigma factor SigC [Ilumatobacter coccineus YM16-304]